MYRILSHAVIVCLQHVGVNDCVAYLTTTIGLRSAFEFESSHDCFSFWCSSVIKTDATMSRYQALTRFAGKLAIACHRPNLRASWPLGWALRLHPGRSSIGSACLASHTDKHTARDSNKMLFMRAPLMAMSSSPAPKTDSELLCGQCSKCDNLRCRQPTRGLTHGTFC